MSPLPGLAESLGTLAAQALDAARARARRDAQRLAAVERRDLDLGAAQRLGHRQRHLDLDVVALAREDRRLLHVRDDVEVARRTAVAARLALAGEADPAALADAGRDVDAVALDRPRAALAAAGRARVLDDRAGAAAARARLGDREQALTLALDPAAVAARADDRRRARLRAGARARRAALERRHRDRDLRAVDRLLEADRDLRLEVATALGARARRPAAGTSARLAEEVRQDVAEAARVEAGLAAAAAADVRERVRERAVVLLALVRVAEDVVRLRDLLEALLGLRVARVLVRVVLARELAVGLLDLVLRGLALDAEHLVVILDGHASS